MVSTLQHAGFQQLFEKNTWALVPGNAYYIIRDNGALAAFTLPPQGQHQPGFKIIGAHTDSPALQVKPIPATTAHSFVQLGVEVYGGPLLAPWFDRDLSIAGRVVCTSADGLLPPLLIDFKRPMAIIPSLAIHLDREANNGRAINRQKNLAPIFSQISGNNHHNFADILIEQIRKEHPDKSITSILGFDLFCYDCQAPSLLGLNNEFIVASRLDNLLSCFVGLTALTQAMGHHDSHDIRVLICNNHEEIGSLTAAGAKGSFLHSILRRIQPEPAQLDSALRQSLFVSLDNAHGVHPNFSDTTEPNHAPLLNHGPVIKSNANHNYATSSMTAALYKTIATEAGVATQNFVMRSDMTCGSTIGPHSAATLGIPTVDVGAPTLAMHSIREMTGRHDPFLLYQTMIQFFTHFVIPQFQN